MISSVIVAQEGNIRRPWHHTIQLGAMVHPTARSGGCNQDDPAMK
jgi:hypothetical protein